MGLTNSNDIPASLVQLSRQLDDVASRVTALENKPVASDNAGGGTLPVDPATGEPLSPQRFVDRINFVHAQYFRNEIEQWEKETAAAKAVADAKSAG